MSDVNRRDALRAIATTGLVVGGVSATGQSTPRRKEKASMILRQEALPRQGPWPTLDPFLFCVHHQDAYPAGDGALAPKATLAGRRLGQDFSGLDGWSMYHGTTVPGFPRHPHRGFETITIVRDGLIDHSDSLGGIARYGPGDVQWLTAGNGISHAEMFPLVQTEQTNPTDFFQVWINLPAARKRVEPHFSMSWDEAVPRIVSRQNNEGESLVRVIAGAFSGQEAPPPPPNSYGSQSESDILILTIEMTGATQVTLPPCLADTTRAVYTVDDRPVLVGDDPVEGRRMAVLTSGRAHVLTSGAQGARLFVLQAKPIGEPVVQYGPFVMNTRAEINEAFRDYRATEFGGWPWTRNDPIHGSNHGRFAQTPKGGRQEPG